MYRGRPQARGEEERTRYRVRSRSRGPEPEDLTPEERAAVDALLRLKNDPDVILAFDDAEEAAEGRGDMGGIRRKRRGGAKGGRKLAEAVADGEQEKTNKSEAEVIADLQAAAKSGGDEAKAEIATVIAANPNTIKSMVSRAFEKAGELKNKVVQPVAIVVGAAVALNRPTFYGNIARVAASTLNTAVNTAITSKWSDWGQTGLDILSAVKSVGDTLYQQSIQGPVVPFTVGLMIQSYRASNRKMGILELTKADAALAAKFVSEGIQGQKKAFDEALAAEKMVKPLAQLRAAAANVQGMSTGTMYSMGYRPETGFSYGGPSAQQALAPLADASAADIEANAQSRRDIRKTMEGVYALQDLRAGPPAPGAMEDGAMEDGAMEDGAKKVAPPGGRRRRKTKRKAPKRRRATRKLLTFVY